MTNRIARVDAGSFLLLATAFLLATGLFVAFAFHSYHPTDQGYILAYSWRWVGDQTPYVDFVYRRPPLSFMLHSVWFALPDGWVILGSRAGFYLQVTLSAALTYAAAHRAGLVRSPAGLAMMGAACTVIALHRFPIMVWYTVDAVFFSYIGLAGLLLSYRSSSPNWALVHRALASLAFCAAALSKQNFVFVALAFALLATIELAIGRRREAREAWRLYAASALPALGLAATMAVWLASQGALVEMLEQAAFPSTSSKLVRIGFERYWGSDRWWAVFPGFVWAWAALRERQRLPWLAPLTGVLVIAGIAGYLVTHFDVGRGLAHLLTGVTIGRLAAQWVPGRAEPPEPDALLRILLTLAVLVIAWTSSLSFGIRNPLIGLAGLAVVVDDLMPTARRLPKALALVVPAALCGAALYAMTYQQLEKPYFERPVSLQIRTLAEFAPRYGPITTNQATGHVFDDLVELIERHALSRDRDFVVLDQFPLIHYAMDRQSPALMDWYLAFEMPGMPRALTKQLTELDAVFFLHRRGGVSVLGISRPHKHDCRASDFDNSRLRKKRIFARGRLLESTPHFCVVDMRGGRRPGSGPARPGRASPR